MTIYNLTNDVLRNVPSIKLEDYRNQIQYICIKDTVLMLLGKTYHFKKDDIIIADDNKIVISRLTDSFRKIIDINDILNTYLNIGNKFIEIPIDLSDGVSKTLIFNAVTNQFEWGVGGGGGSLIIQDEGVPIGTTTVLNFIGADVLAQSDTGRINVFIPPPTFPSHLNTADGTTNANIGPSFATTNRILSSPTSEGVPFKLGTWAGGETREAIRNTTITYTSTGFFRIPDLATTLRISVFDSDGIEIAFHEIANINGNYSATVNNIFIQMTSFSPFAMEYQAVLNNVTVNIANILPNSGRFTVRIRHTIGAAVYQYLSQSIFFDDTLNLITIGDTIISETVGFVNIRNISGVSYYDLNSRFTVNLDNIDYSAWTTYPSIVIETTGADFGLVALNLQNTNLTGFTGRFDNQNLTYIKTDWNMGVAEYYSVNPNARVHATPKDWIDGAVRSSIGQKIAICSYTNNSTRIFEDFKTELNRLKNDMTGGWDSIQDITSYEGGTGLQFAGSRLIYPNFDYTGYSPNIPNQPNYSGAVGDKDVKLRFYHTSVAHSNGMIRLTDYNITEASLASGDVVVEISMNNIAWFNAGKDYLGGALVNGAGCRINKDTNGLIGAMVNNGQLQFTLGTGGFTSAGTGGGWGIFVRITYKDSVTGRASYMGSIEITNWI